MSFQPTLECWVGLCPDRLDSKNGKRLINRQLVVAGYASKWHQKADMTEEDENVCNADGIINLDAMDHPTQ